MPSRLRRWRSVRCGAGVRDYLVAQHEAAHIVVGLAVGLRCRRAVLHETPNHGTWRQYGAVWFNDRHATPTQLGLAIAAGAAWDAMIQPPAPVGYVWTDGDAALLREMNYTRREIDALVVAASAILAGRVAIHQRCARALYDRDLTAVDVSRIAAGERLRDGG